ncbi:MAG: tetratricopeptide repeat protein, partial [Bacteroidota bacterium]|nr:tetratricopeptide repeat protein [Bacteroidota bacterium]
VILMRNGEIIYEKRTDIGPGKPFTTQFKVKRVPDPQYRISLLDRENKELISYQEQKPIYEDELPEPVSPPAKPADIENMEELVLAGQRIMQFHNPGLDPEDYFLEAISRDPYNSMANLHLGNLAAKAGKFDEAADYYRKTIGRITKNYTRPRDCEALFRLGVVLKKQKKYDAAIDTLYRATWDQAWYAAAYKELAEISMLKGDFNEALDQLNHSLSRNAVNPISYAMKSAVLRQTGNRAEAGISARRARVLDPLDHMATFELLLNKAIPSSEFITLLNDNKENYLELTCRYINAGLIEDAAGVVYMALTSEDSILSSYPILYYYGAWLAEKQEDKMLVAEYYSSAAAASTDYVFPFRFETLEILEAAIDFNPADARAWYYMGNILYDHQPDKALNCWKQAVELEHGLAIAHRNLGWGYYRYLDDIEGAIGYYETAVDLKEDDPRYYYELDILYEMNNESLERRLELFASNPGVVRERNDSYLREIEVLLLNGRYDSAIFRLSTHTFLRQEGVVNLHDLFVDAHLLKGREFLLSGEHTLALEQFLLADTYPSNQLIGRFSKYQKEAQIYYYTGLAYLAMDEKGKAKNYFRKAVDTPAGTSEYLYYRALSQNELGRQEDAMETSGQLIRAGEEALEQAGDLDFFAKFGEKVDINARKANAYYYMALGYLSSGDTEKAQEAFSQAFALKNSILWANIHSE